MAPLRLREEDGFEQARRVRNVIEHLRRGSGSHKPLVVVVANSGVAEEVRLASYVARTERHRHANGRGSEGRLFRLVGLLEQQPRPVFHS